MRNPTADLIKRFGGATLTEEERRTFGNTPSWQKMLSGSRLESVSQMVARQFEDAGEVNASIPLIEEERVTVGSRLLRAALDSIESPAWRDPWSSGRVHARNPNRYDSRILDTFDHVSVKLPILWCVSYQLATSNRA